MGDESTAVVWEEAGAEQELGCPPRREGRLVPKRGEGQREGGREESEGGKWMAVATPAATASPQTLSHLSLWYCEGEGSVSPILQVRKLRLRQVKGRPQVTGTPRRRHACCLPLFRMAGAP